MTGHQEYHPVYISPRNIYNTARRGHGIGVLPVAFLPIPKGIIIILLARISSSCIYTFIQLVTRSVRASNSSSSVGNYIINVSRSSSHLFDRIWSLQRLSDVPMDNFARQFLAWGLTLQITQNRCGWLESCPTGAQSELISLGVGHHI
jgi:hypothetical protein